MLKEGYEFKKRIRGAKSMENISNDAYGSDDEFQGREEERKAQQRAPLVPDFLPEQHIQ